MIKLQRRFVDKPWGAVDIPEAFGAPGDRRIGELWFESEDGADLPLLVKYLFTTDRLSVQVHPNQMQAQARGERRGKAECWYIVDCEPDAVIGLGFKESLSPDRFRAGIETGSIIDAMHWQVVRPGDFFSVPPGTVHAIGAGITLAEIQQNSDVTYRLYDYGRPRELHVEQGRPISRLEPFGGNFLHVARTDQRNLINDANIPFSVRQVYGRRGSLMRLPEGDNRWILPLSGSGMIEGESFRVGDCLFLQNEAQPDMLLSEDCTALVAIG